MPRRRDAALAKCRLRRFNKMIDEPLELLHVHRLVEHRPRAGRPGLLANFRRGGHDDDRDPRELAILAKFVQEAPSVHNRHREVGKNQRGSFISPDEAIEGVGAVMGAFYLMAETAQNFCQYLGKVGIVFYNEDEQRATQSKKGLQNFQIARAMPCDNKRSILLSWPFLCAPSTLIVNFSGSTV